MRAVKNLTQRSKPNINWQIIKEIISLSTARGRLIAFGLVLTILIVLPTNKLSLLPVKSVYESVFNFVPFSSGVTRGVSSILHLDFSGAWKYNPLSFAVLGMVAVIMISDLLKVGRSGKR